MAQRLSHTFSHTLQKLLHPRRDKGPRLEDVTPRHPDEYPARHLKEILDGRRAGLGESLSHPTGLPEGPWPRR